MGEPVTEGPEGWAQGSGCHCGGDCSLQRPTAQAPSQALPLTCPGALHYPSHWGLGCELRRHRPCPHVTRGFRARGTVMRRGKPITWHRQEKKAEGRAVAPRAGEPRGGLKEGTFLCRRTTQPQLGLEVVWQPLCGTSGRRRGAQGLTFRMQLMRRSRKITSFPISFHSFYRLCFCIH